MIGKTSINQSNDESDRNRPNLDQDQTDEILDKEFNEEELRKATYSQKPNKSPGIYELRSEILKASYDIISPILLKIYNRMFLNSEYSLMGRRNNNTNFQEGRCK